MHNLAFVQKNAQSNCIQLYAQVSICPKSLHNPMPNLACVQPLCTINLHSMPNLAFVQPICTIKVHAMHNLATGSVAFHSEQRSLTHSLTHLRANDTAWVVSGKGQRTHDAFPETHECRHSKCLARRQNRRDVVEISKFTGGAQEPAVWHHETSGRKEK